MCEHSLTVIAPFRSIFILKVVDWLSTFCTLLFFFVILSSSVYHQEHCLVIIKLPQVDCRDKVKLLPKTKEKEKQESAFVHRQYLISIYRPTE